jgi:hypothetical protein
VLRWAPYRTRESQFLQTLFSKEVSNRGRGDSPSFLPNSSGFQNFCWAWGLSGWASCLERGAGTGQNLWESWSPFPRMREGENANPQANSEASAECPGEGTWSQVQVELCWGGAGVGQTTLFPATRPEKRRKALAMEEYVNLTLSAQGFPPRGQSHPSPCWAEPTGHHHPDVKPTKQITLPNLPKPGPHRVLHANIAGEKRLHKSRRKLGCPFPWR